MTAQERVEGALHSAEPARALRSLVQNLSQEGYTKQAIYDLLEQSVLWLRQREGHQESDEDPILDVMDALTGWCHPSAHLLPEEEVADRNGG